MVRDDSVHGHHGHGKSSDKPSKPRIPQPKMTMKEMVKRVKQISTYISQTQIEMATKATTMPTPLTGRADSSSTTTTQSSIDADKDDIRSTEMMDALTRKIVRWQKTYGWMTSLELRIVYLADHMRQMQCFHPVRLVSSTPMLGAICCISVHPFYFAVLFPFDPLAIFLLAHLSKKKKEEEGGGLSPFLIDWLKYWHLHAYLRGVL
jgi:hypothetical protein